MYLWPEISCAWTLEKSELIGFLVRLAEQVTFISTKVRHNLSWNKSRVDSCSARSAGTASVKVHAVTEGYCHTRRWILPSFFNFVDKTKPTFTFGMRAFEACAEFPEGKFSGSRKNFFEIFSGFSLIFRRKISGFSWIFRRKISASSR
jgi:hypothetical protein